MEGKCFFLGVFFFLGEEKCFFFGEEEGCLLGESDLEEGGGVLGWCFGGRGEGSSPGTSQNFRAFFPLPQFSFLSSSLSLILVMFW